MDLGAYLIVDLGDFSMRIDEERDSLRQEKLLGHVGRADLPLRIREKGERQSICPGKAGVALRLVVADSQHRHLALHIFKMIPKGAGLFGASWRVIFGIKIQE